MSCTEALGHGIVDDLCRLHFVYTSAPSDTRDKLPYLEITWNLPLRSDSHSLLTLSCVR